MDAKPRAMFMNTWRLEPEKDLVHVGLMDCAKPGEPADGVRPKVEGETLEITVPLSQFGPLLGELEDAYHSLPGHRAS
jgi:hypothetical protein